MVQSDTSVGQIAAHRDPSGITVFRGCALLFLLQGCTYSYLWAQQNRNTSALPQACRRLGQSSPDISRLLSLVAQQPSADAYRALGEAYTDQNELNCSIGAYQAALRL